MLRKIDIQDVIEIFLRYTIHEIKEEKEVPNINFHFQKDGYLLFFKMLNTWKDNTNHNYYDDIVFLMQHSKDDCITLNIHNSMQFFNYLKDIINETIRVSYQYGDNVNPYVTATYLLRRIWLRLGINDIENMQEFLAKQLSFIQNRTFDTLDDKRVNTFKDYDVLMRTKVNDLWDETTRRMVFTLQKDNDIYELPHILYDIDGNTTCYIYGVQSSQNEKSKKIVRALYTLNKGILNPCVHPSKVCALLLFMAELEKVNINKIIVPSMQVLSYHYHELLSIEAKKNYQEILEEYALNPDDSYLKNRCEYIKNWYLHVYEKEDKISYLKTEELLYLVYRLLEHKDNMEITNEINLQGDSLNIKIKKY